eukprot:g1674.t1
MARKAKSVLKGGGLGVWHLALAACAVLAAMLLFVVVGETNRHPWGDEVHARSIGFTSREQMCLVHSIAELDGGDCEASAASRDTLHFRANGSGGAGGAWPVNQYEGFRVPVEGWRCDRIDAPAAGDFFRDFIAARRPVIIRPPANGSGTAFEHLGWRTHRWSDEYLLRKAGSQPVEVEAAPGAGGGASGTIRFGVDYKDTTLAQVLSNLNDPAAGEAQYLNVQSLKPQGEQLPAVLKPFRDDFDRPPFVPPALRLHEVNPWWGDTKQRGRAATSPLHYDPFDNLYALLRGRKTFRLVSPADAGRLYTKHRLDHVSPEGEYTRTNNFPVSSFAEVRQIGLPGTAEPWPRFGEATVAQCELVAGEILYLPSGWFHEVVSYGAAEEGAGAGGGGAGTRHMALNFWFHPPHRGGSAAQPYPRAAGPEQTLACCERAVRALARAAGAAEQQHELGALRALGALHAQAAGEDGDEGVGGGGGGGGGALRALLERMARSGAAAGVAGIERCQAAAPPRDSVFGALAHAAARHKAPELARAGLLLHELALRHGDALRGLWKNDADQLWGVLAHDAAAARQDWGAARAHLLRAESLTPFRTRTQFMLGKVGDELGEPRGAARAYARRLRSIVTHVARTSKELGEDPARCEIVRAEQDRPEGLALNGVSLALLKRFADEYNVGPGMTAANVCTQLVKPATNEARMSLAAVLQGGRDRRAPWCGAPTHFISYAWSYSFRTLIDIVEHHEQEFPPGKKCTNFYFLDQFSLNQHKFGGAAVDAKSKPGAPGYGAAWQADTKKLQRHIVDALTAQMLKAGHVLMCLWPLEAPTPLRRAWCLFELWVALRNDIKVTMCFGSADADALHAAVRGGSFNVAKVVGEIRAQDAGAMDETDRQLILGLIDNEMGVDRFNTEMQERLIVCIQQTVARAVMHCMTDDADDW